MLARLWRREVEAVVEPPPLMAPEPSPEQPVEAPQGGSLRESLVTPGRKSLREPSRRRPVTLPVVRIWLRNRETPPPPRPTHLDHAVRLLRWVRNSGYAGKMVPAMDLKKIYPVMCEELGWQPYRWQPVACEFRKLTGGRKFYRQVDAHRRRVYRIPRA